MLYSHIASLCLLALAGARAEAAAPSRLSLSRVAPASDAAELAAP